MRRFENFVPLIVAIISATALLSGYMYQKHKEKDAEMRKTRQDIYAAYVTAMEIERLMDRKLIESEDQTRGDKERQKLRTEVQQLQDKWELEKGSATGRMAVFCESAVVQALAKYWRETQPTSCGPGWKKSIEFFRVMRENAMPEEKPLSDEDLAELFLRCTPTK